MNEKKIAFFTPSIDEVSETFIRLQLVKLSPVLIFFSGFDTKKYKNSSDGISRKIVRLRHVISNKILPRKYKIEKNKLIIQLLEKYEIEILVFQYSLTAIQNYGWLRDCKIPYIIHFHGFDMSCDYILNDYPFILKNLVENASGLISVSSSMTERILNISRNLRGTIITQPCPASVQMLNSTINGNSCLSTDSLCVVINGRFVNKKAPFFHLFVIKRLLDVMKLRTQHFVKFQVKWIGGGELLEATKNLCCQLNLDHIVDFCGELNHKDALNILFCGDIYLQFSHKANGGDREGTPVSLLEAGSLGLACLGTKHEGIKDVIEDGINGFLVDEGDIEAAMLCLLQLINDENIRLKFGNKIRDKIKDEFSEDLYFYRFVELININNKSTHETEIINRV